MSITIRSYKNPEGLTADIRYNKGSLAPELLISLYGQTVYRNTYMTTAGCRKAMNRFGTGWHLEGGGK